MVATDRKQKLLDMEYYTTKLASLKEKLAKTPEDPTTKQQNQRNQEKFEEASRALETSTNALQVTLLNHALQATLFETLASPLAALQPLRPLGPPCRPRHQTPRVVGHGDGCARKPPALCL